MSENIVVLMCTRNRGHLLVHTLRSIARQNRPDVEVRVIDDGSTDGTHLMMDEFPWVNYKFVPRPEKMDGWQESGPRFVNPTIESFPPGTIVILTCAEVIHHTNCISELAGRLVELEKDPGGKWAVFATVVNAPLEMYPGIIESRGKWLPHAPQVYSGIGRRLPSFFLGAIRRESWVEVGGIPRGFHGDKDMIPLFEKAGTQFHFHPTSLGYHCSHGKS